MLWRRLFSSLNSSLKCASKVDVAVNKVDVNLRKEWARKLEGVINDTRASVREIEKHALKTASCQESANRLFTELCQRRLEREPLQYVIGEWDFRWTTLLMQKPVFIPRPETEGLIDLLNDDIIQNDVRDILEIGCGSGAISLSLLKENPQVNCTAIDVLKGAVNLTKLNAQRLKLEERLSCYQSDLSSWCFGEEKKFGMIVSNPPYIPSYQIPQLQPEVKLHESHYALDGGHDGLDVVNQILSRTKHLLTHNGKLWLEVDSNHPEKIRSAIDQSNHPQLRYLNTHLDCFERPRFCEISMDLY